MNDRVGERRGNSGVVVRTEGLGVSVRDGRVRGVLCVLCVSSEVHVRARHVTR